MLQLSRAQSFFRQSVHESVSANTLLLADQAAEKVGRNTIDDPYTRIIMTGTVSGLHAGRYHLIKAGIFNAAGLPEKAIAELQDLKKLTERIYGQDETRNQAWSDIVLAEAFLGLRRYEDAIRKAREALVACHHINSMQNVAIITDIYSRIVTSQYGKSHDVKELLEKLVDFYNHPDYISHKVHVFLAQDLEWDPLAIEAHEEIQVKAYTLQEALDSTLEDYRCDPEAALVLWLYA